MSRCYKDIYSHRSNTLKSKVYHTLAQQAPNALILRDKTLHGRRRRVVSQAFSDNTLRSFESQIIRAIQALSVLIQAPELSIRAIQKTLFLDAIISRDRFVKFIRKLLGIRLMASEVEKKDVFSYIEKAKDPDTGMGLDQLELSAETATMIVAGKGN